MERLPLTGDAAPEGRLRLRSLAKVVDDEQSRAVLAQIARLEALLLAVGLESCARDGSAPWQAVASWAGSGRFDGRTHGGIHVPQLRPGFGGAQHVPD